MSILNTPDVSPSRVYGIYHYFSETGIAKESRGNLGEILMPKSLLGEPTQPTSGLRGMVQRCIDECVAMGLLKNESEYLSLHPQFSDIKAGDFRFALTDNILASDNERNHDLARAIAWYLSCDVYSAPGNWKSLEQSKQHLEFARNELLLNDTRFGQLRDWICFLGFGWMHTGKQLGTFIVPEPSRQLQRRILDAFKDQPEQAMPLKSLMDFISKSCPVFEKGVFRDVIEQKFAPRAPEFLSTSTTCALLSLQSKGFLNVEMRSDAPVVVLDDGGVEMRYSHISLNESRKET